MSSLGGSDAGMLIGMADGVLMLVVDTCGAEGSVALAEVGAAEALVLGVVRMPGRSASERLSGTVREVLAGAGRGVGEIGVIAVVRGPGSFTGVRIGVAAVKGLMEALGVPVIGLSRLGVMAAAYRARAGVQEVVAMLDAGREEVFCGFYGSQGELQWERLLTRGAARAVEAGIIACEAAVAEATGAAVVPAPDAATAVEMAAERWRAGQLDDAATLDALYLRRTAAEIALGQRVGVAGPRDGGE